MDPSLFSCSVLHYENIPNPEPFSSWKEKEVFPEKRNINEVLPNPFTIPLKNFSQEEALLWADIDATFRFTDVVPSVFWAFPTGSYPARQAFSVSYLTPRLIGNFNIGLWNCPGLQYFSYRRPEYFAYCLVTDKEILQKTPPQQNLVITGNSQKHFDQFLREITSVQVDGLDLFISWEDPHRSLYLALKTLRIGGNCCLRVTDPSLSDLTVASNTFQEMYLFKPVLSNPFTKERFLILKGKKENYASGLVDLEGSVKVTPKVTNWLIEKNNFLNQYADNTLSGLYAPLFPSKCYIKWNLPDLDVPQEIVCLNKDSYLTLLEEETGTEKKVIDSNTWNRRTDTLALIPRDNEYEVYEAKPYYLGGWNWVGVSSSVEGARAGKNCYSI